MKPEKLIMSAFCPYADKVEIDFSVFEDRGLFLISGETGAGKTTIFDGISYALYGEVSGSTRGVDCLRSDFARSDVPTFVHLTFEHKNIIYEIERTPRYSRPKKRGGQDEMVVQPPTAKLTTPERVIEGIKDVEEKIVEILGLNHQQFKQIVMIAQGEFLKLLLADSNERGEILRKIFNTELFNKLQSSLKDRCRQLEYEKLKIEESVNQHYESLIFSAQDNKEKMETLKSSIYRLPDVLIFLQHMLEDTEKKHQQLKLQKEDIEKQLEGDMEKLSLSKQLNDIIESISFHQNIIDEKTPLLVESQNVLAHMKEQKPVRDKLSYGINELEKTIPQYQEISKKKKEFESIKSSLHVKIKRRDELNELIQKQNEKINAVEEELSHIKDIDVSKSESDYQCSSAAEKKRLLEQLLSDYKKCKNQEKHQNELSKIYIESEKQYKKFAAEYELMEQQFFMEQAGILAEALQPAMPCPVCGSTEHPKPALQSENAPSQRSLELKKKELEKYRHKREKASEETGNALAKLETMKDSFFRSFHDITDDGQDDWKDIDIILQQKILKQREELELLLARHKIIVEQLNRKNECIKLQEEIRNNLKQNELLAGSIKEEIAEEEKLIARYETEIKLLESNLVYTGEEEAKRKLENQKQQLLQMQLAQEQAEQKCKELHDKITSASAVINESKENGDIIAKRINLPGLPEGKINLLPMEEDRIASSRLKKSIEEEISNIEHEIKTNSGIIKNLMKCQKLYKELEELYGAVKLLDNTANGKLKGANMHKITFETYVQQVYFDMVLTQANQRLLQMTDNRFALIRREDKKDGRSKTGLELDVSDSWNGRRREAKTLSGGEAFKASLSLALGLSDVVQSFSGGVELDAMFIDEGFGTLDSESLEKAIDIISQLADGYRLVGIISHVDELKERIDNKIVIEKDKQGSKLCVLGSA